MPGPVRLLLRRGSGVVAALLLAVGGVSWSAAPAASLPAKDCQSPGGVSARAAAVEAVFTAQVTSQKNRVVGTGDTQRRVRDYQATVERVYQGTVTSKQVVVVSPRSVKNNGLGPIPTDKTWLFFVNGADAKFFGNACQGSERATSALLRRVERVLGSGHGVVVQPPEGPPLEWTERDTSTPPTLGRMIAPGAAATIVGLLGLLAVGRLGRRSSSTA